MKRLWTMIATGSAIALMLGASLTPWWRLADDSAKGASSMSLGDIGPLDEYFLAKVSFYGAFVLAAFLVISVLTSPRAVSVWTGVMSGLMAVLFLVASLVADNQMVTQDLAHNMGPNAYIYAIGCVVAILASVLSVRDADSSYGGEPAPRGAY